MNVSKYKIVLNPVNNDLFGDKFLDIPVELSFDLLGQDDAIDEIQEETVERVIGKPIDFECERFANKQYPNTAQSDINYIFNFFDFSVNDISNSNSWINSYGPQQFNENELYYTSKSFSKSFFKIDLYDTDDSKTQINYLTLIIPTNSSIKTEIPRQFLSTLKPIKLPKFNLDYIGYKESFFIYWLKNTDYLDLKTFYMAAKFFNGKTGEFVKMTNTPQSSIGTRYNFNPSRYFYYKVKLDYNDYTYEVFDYTSQVNEVRIGSTTNPIKWYQYVNP
jgi:hypothetical protein